jgi:N-acetylglucosaminyl-diphospho-decaprenol L-rhamnosyltransferase
MIVPDPNGKLSVIVLNFRTAEQTVRAIERLSDAAPGADIEVVVVDNASADGSAQAIQDRCPEARVIELAENMGFAAGMNAGARETSGEYVLLLNSDVEATAGSLDALTDYMRANPDVGLSAPLLVDENDKPTRTLLVGPTLWRTLLPALGKLRYRQWRSRIGAEPLDVEATEGAAVLVSRAAIERAGLLDEGFFFYHEIVEWCMRIRDAGFRIVVVPSSRMKHLRGASTGGVWLPARIELKRSEYQLLGKRLGRAVRLFAIARDVLCEAGRCVVYRLAVVSGAESAHDKLAAHAAVLKWIVMGMPGRRDKRYISSFGGWE